MKKMLALIMLMSGLTSCIHISLHANRSAGNITGHDIALNIFDTRTPVREDSVGGYRLVLVKNDNGTAWTLLAEISPTRKFRLLGKHRRHIELYKLADIGSTVNFNAANIDTLRIPIGKICDIINSLKPGYTLVKVIGHDASGYFTGIFIQRIPCETSTLVKIQTGLTYAPGISPSYTNTRIKCPPPDSLDSLIDSAPNGKIHYFQSPASPAPAPTAHTPGPQPQPAAANPNDPNNPGSNGFGFDHNCLPNLLEIRILPMEDSGKIFIRKRTDSVWNMFRYGSSFDPISYLTELERLYSNADRECLKALVERISHELLLKDSLYIHCRFCHDDSTKNNATKKAVSKTTETQTTDTSKQTPAAPKEPSLIAIRKKDPIIIEPVYSANTGNNILELHLDLQLQGPFDQKGLDTVKFKFSDTAAMANKLTLVNRFITINRQQWEDAIDKNNGILPVIILANSKSLSDSLANTQNNLIVLDGQGDPNNGQEIQLRAYNPNKPFWVEFGANFDLLDKLQTNNLYGAVIMYKRDVARLASDKPNIGLFGGVYEAKTVSEEQSFDFANLQYLDNASFNSPGVPPNNLVVHRDTGTASRTTSVNNLGLFFSPQVRLTNGSANADGLHVFASLWLEMIWQRTTTTFDYSQTKSIGTITVPSSLENSYQFRPQTLKNDFRSHYFGLGLPIYLKEGNANLYVNSVIGVANQPGLYNKIDKSDLLHQTNSFFQPVKLNQSGNPSYKMFYLFQFRLNEEKYGISFTGEVRGVLARYYKPFVTLSLSKKFDLSKLIEFK